MRPTKALTAAVMLLAMIGAAPATAPPPTHVRLVILMVWDGLRPDSVTAAATPNLYRLEHDGVSFTDHHASYPTMTMVNAAALATGQPPGVTNIWGNNIYLAPFLPPSTDRNSPPLPISLESSSQLEALNAKAVPDGRLMPAEAIARKLVQNGGWFAAVGKQGPTFLFDDAIAGPSRGAEEILIADDELLPHSLFTQFNLAQYRAARTVPQWQVPPFAGRDSYFVQVASQDLLTRARQALTRKQNAWMVIWRHNPEATESATGLDTAQSRSALGSADADLGRLLDALARLGLREQTDLIVVSDHGLATLKARVPLAQLLVAQGLKKAALSNDVVVIANGGSDEIFVAPSRAARERGALLRKIAAYCASQEWCGPIFSRPRAGVPLDFRGSVPGTFSQAYFHLSGPRAPDLIVSFRELAADNHDLTGPHAPAFVLAAHGRQTVTNHSLAALAPMAGVVYGDVQPAATTGVAVSGAMGWYELHAFGAAIGPDFRTGYADPLPTSNLDVAWTISRLLALPEPGGAPGIGRVIGEALVGATAPAAAGRQTLRASIALPAPHQVATVMIERMGQELYPDDARVDRRIVPGRRHLPAPAR